MKKRYWLRGGIIGVAIFVVFLVISNVTGYIGVVNYNLECLVPPCGSVGQFYFLGITFLKAPQFWSFILLFLLASFLLGLILGWLYGKIKNRSTPKS